MAKDRTITGPTLSLVVAAVSVGVMIALWQAEWPVARGPALVVHGASALCLLWSLLAWLLAPRRAIPADAPGWSASKGASPVAPSVRGDLVAVLNIAAMALGLLAFIFMVYQASIEVVMRTVFAFIFKDAWRPDIWPAGWLDLTALATALILGRLQTGDRRPVTALFWLTIFAGLWRTLQIPAYQTQHFEAGITRDVATTWSGLFMFMAAFTLAAFTIAGGRLEHRWRVRAWPDKLWRLTTPPPDWPAFRYSAGVVAVVVLVLGCAHIVRPWTPLAAFMAGGAMLALAHRRWEENLADAGLALITLGVTSLVSLWRPAARSESEFFAEIFNRALIGLAIMTAFWHWLANVWVQQLDQGTPWTTAGRLIRTARRVGYLVGATGLLVAIHLAMWPRLPFADLDDSIWRWAWGLAGNLLLVLALAAAAIRTQKSTLAWLCLLAVVTAIAFVLIRVPGSAFMQAWVLYWPLLMTAAAAAVLPLAVVAMRARKWQPFGEPLYFAGILFLPALAITGAALIEQLHLPLWVPSATFGCLTGVYLLAAWLPGPRGFVTVAVICAGVGIYLR